MLPTATTPVSDIISEYPLNSHFIDCIGALDGCHIPMLVSEEKQKTYRNRFADPGSITSANDRKGFISTNVLGVVNLDGRFMYVFPGWEGAAADSRVLDSALQGDFAIPRGKYYLGDAGALIYDCSDIGYALSTQILTPFRGVRYHLKEWSQSGEQPENYKELFNLRHSTLRNVIERRFGAWKRQFRILAGGSEYPAEIQIKIITATAILSNYIFDDGELIYEGNEARVNDGDPDDIEQHPLYARDERNPGNLLREHLAKAMWRDYSAMRMRRDLNHNVMR